MLLVEELCGMMGQWYPVLLILNIKRIPNVLEAEDSVDKNDQKMLSLFCSIWSPNEINKFIKKLGLTRIKVGFSWAWIWLNLYYDYIKLHMFSSLYMYSCVHLCLHLCIFAFIYSCMYVYVDHACILEQVFVLEDLNLM